VQAYRDNRLEVVDSIETIKRMDMMYPFNVSKFLNLPGLVFSGDQSPPVVVAGELGYSCSYHVALWMQLCGIPCWLHSMNDFYAQKARALQVKQPLQEFLTDPLLADHRGNLERREKWTARLQRELDGLPEISNVCEFSRGSSDAAAWKFYY